MKRDVYEHLKVNPDTWFTVEDIAKHFNVEYEYARCAIYRASRFYHLFLHKTIEGRVFVKFDTYRFNMMP